MMKARAVFCTIYGILGTAVKSAVRAVKTISERQLNMLKNSLNQMIFYNGKVFINKLV